MDLPSQHYERLIHLIYETIHDAKVWEQVFVELRTALDCKVVHAFAMDKHHGTLSFSTGSNLPVAGELSYLQRYQFIDPRSKHWSMLPSQACFHDHEVFDDHYVANSEFYQAFLLPYGVRYLSALKVIEDDDISFSISCLRGPEQGPLSGEAIQFIHRLLPHLHRAVRINTSHFIYSTQALIGHTLINKLKQPVILTTITGKVVLTNDAAQQLLANTGLVSVHEQYLCMPESSLSQFLAECAAIEQHIKNGQYAHGESHSYKVLNLQAKNHCGQAEKLLALYLPLVPQCTLGMFGLRPLIMLMFYHPESTAPVDTTLLSAAFGLSPAECRIASMLAEGYAVIEIAAYLGKKEDTIRKQLQSIYQKTSTNRQPELIKLLMHLPSHINQI
ncbi:MAG: helix-turn-helix transcriptional regulator [Methylophilus sp.]|uniref:helix-turn-helix transcriptional regulator n=1 Tax=Methylophilus sp. TaxID=29541 RepID=UPI003F9FC411